MHMSSKNKAEFARAMRNYHYENTPDGLKFTAQKAQFGGIFSAQVNGGEWVPANNLVTLEFLDTMLTYFFTGTVAPVGFFLVPFTNNVAASSALTAANFVSTQNEYVGYTQPARPQWISNGNSSGQQVSNSNSPATFTIGASSATIRGAGLLTSSTKGSTSGVLVAAALFDVANTLSAGSTLKLQYSLAAAPSA